MRGSQARRNEARSQRPRFLTLGNISCTVHQEVNQVVANRIVVGLVVQRRAPAISWQSIDHDTARAHHVATVIDRHLSHAP
jgi:hypothetical protein